MWILHLYFPRWWQNEESYLLPTCIWTIVTNARFALTNPIQFSSRFEESYLLQSCMHIWNFPKASFGISNDFRCVFCISTLWTVVRMKMHVHCLHASKPGYTQKQLWYLNGLNAKNALKGSILWVLWGTISIAIMTVLKMIQRAAPFAGVRFLHFFFQKCGWWTVKKSENKSNSAQKILLS